MFTGKLYKELCMNENLNNAWNKVRSNKGVAGIDDMAVIHFNKMSFANLLRLKEELISKAYQPRPIKRINLKKPDGGKRPIGILTVEDRIVQRAVLQIIEPLFDRHFSPFSYGYRKGLSTQNAIEQIKRNFNRDSQWVLDADLLEFFDHIDHSLLMREVKRALKDKDILKLLRRWLHIGAMGFTTRGLAESSRKMVGILQGSPLSPLLANIYLNPLDRAIIQKGYKLVRFGDDFIVQCKTKKEVGSALNDAKRILKKLRLEINPHKTQITHFDKGVRFLGVILKSHHNREGKDLRLMPAKPTTKKEENQYVSALPFTTRGHIADFRGEVSDYPGQEKVTRSSGH